MRCRSAASRSARRRSPGRPRSSGAARPARARISADSITEKSGATKPIVAASASGSKVSALKASTIVERPIAPRARWASGRCVRQAPKLPVSAIQASKRRQAEGEAVESELGQADAGLVAELDHRRHEAEAGRRADAQADAEQAVLRAGAAARVIAPSLKHKLSRRAKPRLHSATNMHVYANPARFLKIARPLTAWLGWAGAALIAGALACGPVPRPGRAAAGRERAHPLRPRPRRLARHGGLDRDRASPA